MIINKIGYKFVRAIEWSVPPKGCTSLIYDRGIKADTVSFSCRPKNPLWCDFYSKFKKSYPNTRLGDAVFDMISKQENVLGEGAKKIVYKIDGIEDYVLGFLKEKSPDRNLPFVPFEDPYPNFNFGQPIAGNNSNFIIMKRIFGNTHGVDNWTAKFLNLAYQNEKISAQDALKFLSQLAEIEKFPLSSYRDLAKQVKYLTDKNIKIDMINPNNMITDVKRQKLNYFDLFEKPEVFHPIKPQVNCTQDMVTLITDGMLNAEFVEALGAKDKEKLIRLTKSISEKCKIAGELEGLSSDSSITYKTYSLLQDVLTKKHGYCPDYVGFYKKYQALYQ